MKLAKRKITITTGTRAEYGILRPILKKIVSSKKLQLFLIVTGTHLSKKHGMTINEIKKDKFKIYQTFKFLPNDDTGFSAAKSLGDGVVQFAKIFKKIKPDIIALSMPMMGSDGPHQHYGGNGINIIAGAGISGITGYPHRAPVGTGSLYPDFSGNPNHAAIALLAAIRYRNRTGKGQFIDLAQYESTISLLGTSVLEYTVNNKVPDRPGNKSPNMAPHSVYPCKGTDRWCAIAVSNEQEWSNFTKAIEKPTIVMTNTDAITKIGEPSVDSISVYVGQ